jgi:hypothetical protein
MVAWRGLCGDRCGEKVAWAGGFTPGLAYKCERGRALLGTDAHGTLDQCVMIDVQRPQSGADGVRRGDQRLRFTTGTFPAPEWRKRYIQ